MFQILRNINLSERILLKLKEESMGKLETTIKQFEGRETNYCFKTLSRGGAPLNKVLKTTNKYFEGRKTIFFKTLSREEAPPLGGNQGGRKWRLEGAAAKVRVNEVEEKGGCEEKNGEREEGEEEKEEEKEKEKEKKEGEKQEEKEEEDQDEDVTD